MSNAVLPVAARFLAGLALGVPGACLGQVAQDDVLRKLIRQYGCAAPHIQVIQVRVPKPLDREESCALVSVALANLHDLPQVPNGYLPQDSMHIARATIESIDIVDGGTGKEERYWLVALDVPNERYDVQVPINRKSGDVSPPQNVHKPFEGEK
jgi:hypothetical protein